MMYTKQIFLLMAVAIFAVYSLRFRSDLADRLVFALLVCAGVVLLIVPDLSTTIANGLGVGRGADLVFYLFVIFSLFRFVGLSSQLSDVERRLATIIRTMALDRGRSGGPAPLAPGMTDAPGDPGVAGAWNEPWAREDAPRDNRGGGAEPKLG
jgi:hypothetical protein